MIKNGMLISLEGIDGSGKSTLASLLHQSLQEKGDAVLTKEPGATALGQKIRTIVQEKNVPLCSKSEYLLFAADRAQHFEELIIPALKTQKIVISDRMADSSLVYQGYGRGLDRNTIASINQWAMNSYQPDLTFYIKVPVEIASQRLKMRNQELTSFEKEDGLFMQRVSDGFDALFKNKNNVITLDGTQSPEILAHQATAIVEQWLHAKKRL